jgi:hypothetical protein
MGGRSEDVPAALVGLLPPAEAEAAAAAALPPPPKGFVSAAAGFPCSCSGFRARFWLEVADASVLTAEAYEVAAARRPCSLKVPLPSDLILLVR